MEYFYTTVGVKYNQNEKSKLDNFNSLFDYVKLTISSDKLRGIGSYSLKPGYEAFIDFTEKEHADKFIEVAKKELSDLVFQADIIFPLEHNSSPQSVDLRMWNTPAWQSVREYAAKVNETEGDIDLEYSRASGNQVIKRSFWCKLFRRK